VLNSRDFDHLVPDDDDTFREIETTPGSTPAEAEDPCFFGPSSA